MTNSSNCHLLQPFHIVSQCHSPINLLVPRCRKAGFLNTHYLLLKYRSSNALLEMIWLVDGSVAFRANNGKYVLIKRSGLDICMPITMNSLPLTITRNSTSILSTGKSFQLNTRIPWFTGTRIKPYSIQHCYRIPLMLLELFNSGTKMH